MGMEHEHLAEAERHLAEFRQRIAEQETRIAKLEKDGHDTAEAKALLEQFEETLRQGEDHRQLILKEIARGKT